MPEVKFDLSEATYRASKVLPATEDFKQRYGPLYTGLRGASKSSETKESYKFVRKLSKLLKKVYDKDVLDDKGSPTWGELVNEFKAIGGNDDLIQKIKADKEKLKRTEPHMPPGIRNNTATKRLLLKTIVDDMTIPMSQMYKAHGDTFKGKIPIVDDDTDNWFKTMSRSMSRSIVKSASFAGGKTRNRKRTKKAKKSSKKRTTKRKKRSGKSKKKPKTRSRKNKNKKRSTRH